MDVLRDPVDGPRGTQATVGDEQGAPDAELAQALPGLRAAAPAVEDPGRTLEQMDAVPGNRYRSTLFE